MINLKEFEDLRLPDVNLGPLSLAGLGSGLVGARLESLVAPHIYSMRLTRHWPHAKGIKSDSGSPIDLFEGSDC